MLPFFQTAQSCAYGFSRGLPSKCCPCFQTCLLPVLTGENAVFPLECMAKHSVLERANTRNPHWISKDLSFFDGKAVIVLPTFCYRMVIATIRLCCCSSRLVLKSTCVVRAVILGVLFNFNLFHLFIFILHI